MILIVKNLPPSSTPQSLLQLFTPFGKVLWSRMILDMDGEASGICVCGDGLPRGCTKAVEELDGTVVWEQLIGVAFTSDLMPRRAH